MTRGEALRKLRSLLGPKAKAEVLDKITSPERRAAATERRKKAQAEGEDLNRRIQKQFGAEIKAIQRRLDQASAETNTYKVTVFTPLSIGWLTVAKGDTWEEVFAHLTSSPKLEKSRETESESPF